MARLGTTLQDVKQAKQALLARGEVVSVDSVCDELGDNSAQSIIQEHLDALLDPPVAHTGDELLSKELQILVSQVATRLRSELDKKLVEHEKNYANTLKEKDDQISQLNKKLKDSSDKTDKPAPDLEVINNKLANISIERDIAKQQCEKQEQQIKSLTQELKSLTTNSQSLEKKLAAESISLNELRESVASESQKEIKQFENTIEELNQKHSELSQQNAALTELNESLTLEQAQLNELLTQEQQYRKKFENQSGAQEKALNQYRDINQRLELSIDTLKQELASLRNELTTVNESLNTRTLELEGANSQLETAEAMTKTQERLIADYMGGSRRNTTGL